MILIPFVAPPNLVPLFLQAVRSHDGVVAGCEMLYVFSFELRPKVAQLTIIGVARIVVAAVDKVEQPVFDDFQLVRPGRVAQRQIRFDFLPLGTFQKRSENGQVLVVSFHVFRAVKERIRDTGQAFFVRDRTIETGLNILRDRTERGRHPSGRVPHVRVQNVVRQLVEFLENSRPFPFGDPVEKCRA